MLLAPAALNQQLVYADETELQQSSNQSDAETINKQQNKPNQNSDKDKSTDDKTAANDTNNKKPTADNKSSNANKQSRHNKQTNSALDSKQVTNSAKNTSSIDDSNQTSRASSSSNTANTASINKIHQNDVDKANMPRAKAKASSKKIRKNQQTDDTDLDLYLAKPGYTNSIRSQKQQNTKLNVLSRKVIYHRASANSDNHHALPQASASLLPVLPNTGFKKSVWQHDNHPITLKSAVLGLLACIIFLVAISIPSKRY